MSKQIIVAGCLLGIVLYLMIYSGFSQHRISKLEDRISQQQLIIDELMEENL